MSESEADVGQRVKVANYIRKVWPQYNVLNNGWIVWWADVTPPRTEIHTHMHVNTVRGHKRRGAIVRHPDVMVVDPMARAGHGIRLVIEIDGAVHDDKIVETERRNVDYAMFGVPVITLEPSDLEMDAWREEIRRGIA